MTRLPLYLLSTGLVTEGLIEEAAVQGIVLDSLSFITTRPIADPALGSRIRDLAARPLTAIFTSVAAVAAVKGWLAQPPDWRIFCIGYATRSAAADYFGQAAIIGTAESAGLLAEVIGQAEAGGEACFFCGDHRREELPARLREKGFAVAQWVVYQTIATPHKMERVYDGIAFFSPSAVDSYLSANTLPAGTLLFAIGRTTASAIQARCSNPVVVGERPDKEALIRKMIDHFQTKDKE